MSPGMECKFNSDVVECCVEGSDACYQGEIATLAVNATSAEHVSTTLAWANERNLALTVKSTGHDFQGRSTDSDSLNVWIHYMKEVTYFDNWQSDCSGSQP